MELVSLLGIVIGLVLLMFLAFKGCNIIWLAPVCAMVVAIMSGYSLLDAYLGDYMTGMANYVLSWFPAFFLGAVYGKVMDMTGSARSLADWLVKLIGSKFAVAAVVIPCLLMTYGGISLFVVVFVIYPMGYAIYRAADLPRTLLPGAIAFGAFGITMTAIPGTPQIQNLIPCNYYGTTAMAGLPMSIAAIIIVGIPGYVYLEWRARQAHAKGLHFTPDPKHKEVDHSEKALPSWHWLSGLIPLIVVVLMLNLFPKILMNMGGPELSSTQAIVIALLCGIAICLIMNASQFQIFLSAINEGAVGSMGAIMNTACAVGFGSVVKVVPGFALLTNAALNMPGSILFSEAVAVNLLAGATGSASGGMSIALEALAPKYMEMAGTLGINVEYLHRIASLSSGGLDTLPHNGAVLTLLAVSNCTHKESYLDICVTTCIIPVVGSLLLALVWGIFL
ncbi:MAG: GntP family permease [Oscillibacter sp.]|jgi:H+/gluconate symporter-like permease|nr:GntP family permease [Oscillibacter sp.]MCI8688709.1 GntP family permease [Oscillibacter sp.]MCI9481438.1 GntP family permease [Oscillibacter sp.]